MKAKKTKQKNIKICKTRDEHKRHLKKHTHKHTHLTDPKLLHGSLCALKRHLTSLLMTYSWLSYLFVFPAQGFYWHLWRYTLLWGWVVLMFHNVHMMLA